MMLSLDANIFIYAYITGENIKNDRRLHDRLRAFESYVDVRLLKDMSLNDIKLMSG